MVEPASCRIWQVVLQSGLADEQALQIWWDAIPPEKRTPEGVDRRLAKQGVQSGALTVWQAQQLLAGRSTGFKIDRYVLLELIGQGGMGRVYLARDTRLNRRVALKILSPERVNNPRAIARFHREALVGAQLQHENLVRIYDEGEAGGKCYLVMEYIEGKNIGQMIAEGGPLPPSVAARLARQVALGLEHAQRKGLIHRDVNPYNILVTHDGTAKLTDMGLAIDLGDVAQVTRDGATVGTFDYVSPEQARHSHSVDSRSDVYSLGCTLYHMLTGEVPFPTSSLPEKLFSHQATVPASVRVLSPWVPEGLAEVVAQTLRKAPDERYATPQELAQALEPFVDEPDTPAGDAPPVARGTVPSRGGGGGEATVTRLFASTPAASTSIPTPLPETPPAVAPADEPIGLGINFDAPPTPPAPPPPRARPTAEPKPPAAPAPRKAPAAPPASAPAPPAPSFEVGSRNGPDEADDEPIGLGINLDAPPTPRKPAARKAATPPPPAPPPPPIPTPGPAAADDPLGLGIDLVARARPETAPARPKAPPPAPTPPPPAPVEFERTGEPAGASFGDFGLAVNLGPEPSLSRAAASKARPRGRAATATNLKETTTAAAGVHDAVQAATPRAGRGRPGWFVPAVAAAGVVVVLAGGALVYRQFTGTAAADVTAKGTTKGKVEPTPRKPETTVAAVAPTDPAGGREAAVTPAAPGPSGDIVVMARDGTMSVQPDLKNAIRAAIGSRGHVLLRNKSPLVFKAADFVQGAGRVLAIRAGAGLKPVLKVEVKGGTPFLSTRSDAPLEIEGVTFEVTYVEPGNDPAPVIEAGGAVTLDRCAFRLSTPTARSRAVAVEGGTLDARGCWFENFDRAVDVACFAGSKAELRHCMVVATAPSPDDKLAGTAAVRLRDMPGTTGKTGRRLTLDRCTVRSGGFLDCAGFAPESPIEVSATGCAVAADFLLTWEPAPTGDTLTKDAGPFNADALKWKGRDNQYDVRGTDGWVRLVAIRVRAPTPLPDGPRDLNAWSQRFPGETDAAASTLKFATDPATLSQTPSPADFAVADTGVHPRGADPSLVGPGAQPLSTSR